MTISKRTRRKSRSSSCSFAATVSGEYTYADGNVGNPTWVAALGCDVLSRGACNVLNRRRTFALASDPTSETKFSISSLPDPCEDSGSLKAKAERCRRLAAGISDRQAAEVLKGMARSYQDAADRLDGENKAG